MIENARSLKTKMRGYHSCGDFGMRPKSYRPFPSSAFPQTVSNKLAPGGENPPGAFLSPSRMRAEFAPGSGSTTNNVPKVLRELHLPISGYKNGERWKHHSRIHKFLPKQFPPEQISPGDCYRGRPNHQYNTSWVATGMASPQIKIRK